MRKEEFSLMIMQENNIIIGAYMFGFLQSFGN